MFLGESFASAAAIAKKRRFAYPWGTKMKEKTLMAENLVSRNELVRRAAAYIAEERAAHPEKSLSTLLDEAGMRFNLTPLDAAALERIFQEEKN